MPVIHTRFIKTFKIWWAQTLKNYLNIHITISKMKQNKRPEMETLT